MRSDPDSSGVPDTQPQVDAGPHSVTERAPPPSQEAAAEPGSITAVMQTVAAAPLTAAQSSASSSGAARQTLPEAAFERPTHPGALAATIAKTSGGSGEWQRQTLHSPEALRTAGVGAPAPPAPTPARELPADAPPWMKHAEELARSLEWALERQEPSPVLIASIERAYEAWQAGGFSCNEIAQVATLVADGYRRLKAASAERHLLVRRECTERVHRELPMRVKRWVSLAFVDALLQELHRYGDERTARRKGTMRLLGWDLSADRWADELIQRSLET